MTCPTCERLGRTCLYCSTLCPCERANAKPSPPCACVCHDGEREREAAIQAERVARIQLG